MNTEIRVRVAPSPTGVPHIGFARTALYDFLFAKKNKGKFILRIEDTDQARYIPETVDQIIEMLNWLGLRPDEGPKIGGEYGPYSQSERLPLYQKYAKELLDKDLAYYCFCTTDRLEKMRKDQEGAHLPPKYDRTCRKLTKEEVTQKLKEGVPYVIRLKVPDEGKSEWNDIVHGHIEIENSLVDDQVLIKSDGYPTYHFAVVIDDHLMKISQVLRGVEWISSTPKHLLLYKAFGWEPPQFAHLPLVRGPDKAKLSKRHGAKSALEYRDEGYLPEAILNTILFWGWGSSGDQDLYSMEEMIGAFSLEAISKSDPIVNLSKLDWFNGQYIRKKSVDQLSELLKPFLQSGVSPELVKKVIPLVQDRLVKLSDWQELSNFFFQAPQKYDDNLLQSHEKDKVKIVLEKGMELFNKLPEPWDHKEWEMKIRDIANGYGWKHADVFQIYRVAVSGKTATPPLFETMEVLGKEEVIKRLQTASKALN